MAQLRDGLRLALEPIARLLIIGEVAVQDLDRDDALQRAIDPAIHDRHPALADSLQELVLVEDLTNLDQLGSAMTKVSGRSADVQ